MPRERSSNKDRGSEIQKCCAVAVADMIDGSLTATMSMSGK